MNEHTLGQIAYDAYCNKRGWKSVKGDPLPQFKDQSIELQEAWEDAADAAIEEFCNREGL